MTLIRSAPAMSRLLFFFFFFFLPRTLVNVTFTRFLDVGALLHYYVPPVALAVVIFELIDGTRGRQLADKYRIRLIPQSRTRGTIF